MMFGPVGDAVALHSRLGKDAHGRSLLAEQRTLLDDLGVVSAAEREFLIAHWSAVDDEIAAHAAEEMKRLREQSKGGGGHKVVKTMGG